jgi:hypothetical protein
MYNRASYLPRHDPAGPAHTLRFIGLARAKRYSVSENFDRAFWRSPAAGIFILYGINCVLGLSWERLIRTTRFSHFASLHQPPTAELSPGDECATLNKGFPIASPIHKSQASFKGNTQRSVERMETPSIQE